MVGILLVCVRLYVGSAQAPPKMNCVPRNCVSDAGLALMALTRSWGIAMLTPPMPPEAGISVFCSFDAIGLGRRQAHGEETTNAHQHSRQAGEEYGLHRTASLRNERPKSVRRSLIPALLRKDHFPSSAGAASSDEFGRKMPLARAAPAATAPKSTQAAQLSTRRPRVGKIIDLSKLDKMRK